jgi:hypothetical protein
VVVAVEPVVVSVAVAVAVGPNGAPLVAPQMILVEDETLFVAFRVPFWAIPTSEFPKLSGLGETPKIPAALADVASSANRAMTEVADTKDAFITTPRSFRLQCLTGLIPGYNK